VKNVADSASRGRRRGHRRLVHVSTFPGTRGEEPVRAVQEGIPSGQGPRSTRGAEISLGIKQLARTVAGSRSVQEGRHRHGESDRVATSGVHRDRRRGRGLATSPRSPGEDRNPAAVLKVGDEVGAVVLGVDRSNKKSPSASGTRRPTRSEIWNRTWGNRRRPNETSGPGEALLAKSRPTGSRTTNPDG